MTNLFRMTPDKSLDRQYLRICAVYRSMKRYGMSKTDASARLMERGLKAREADALITIWRGVSGFPAA